jgi:pilus assembly protein TadC
MVERRVRTWWVVRERYRRVAWAASALGGFAALLLVLLALRDDGPGALASPGFLGMSLLFLAAGVVVPRWIVNALWRRQKKRNALDWS